MSQQLSLSITCLALAAALRPTATVAQTYSDADLLTTGREAYADNRCVTAARYLFAYILRNPATGDRRAIENAIEWCEQNSTLYAGTRGKADAAAEGGGNLPPRPPLISSPIAPTAATPSPVIADKRCHAYARVAVVQNELNAASECGLGGNRWQSDYRAHYEWCRVVPSDATIAETSERQKALEACVS